jgi:hypothetical protein
MKLAAVGAVVAASLVGAFGLTACDSHSAPDCSKDGISASGTNGTCTFSPSYQNDAGMPVVWVDCLDSVTNTWVHGPSINIANRSDDTQAQCSTYPHRVAALAAKAKHS